MAYNNFFNFYNFIKIPLLISYLKGTNVRFPFITIVHVWSGVLLIIVVLIRAFMNRKRLKIMLIK